MKKLCCAILAVFGLLLFGCNEKEIYAVLITNESSKTVSYDYNDSSHTLNPEEAKPYDVGVYTPPPQNIQDDRGVVSIVMRNWQGEKYTFADIIEESFNLRVINTLPFDVTIRAGRYIDNGKPDTDNATELTIAAGSDTDNAVIYTKKPNFRWSPQYPAVINWNIVKDTDRDTMMVIIR